MKLPRRQLLQLAAGAAALPGMSRIARAQAYPTRPVRIVVGFASGGIVDVLARLIGQWLSERMGQQFVVENRTGAGSNLAIEDAGARAQASQCLDNEREATGEVIAGTAIEPHLRALLAGIDAEAVVLDFMQPLAAGRQFVGFGWKARRDEPGREGTLQHVD